VQFKDGTKVYTANGDHVGSIDRVVIDPRTKEVSYIVVRKGFLFTEDKLVPIGMIASADEDRLTLRMDAGNLDDLPLYEEAEYVPLEAGEYPEQYGGAVGAALPLYWYPTSGAGWYPGTATPLVPVDTYAVHTEPNIPEGTVGLKEGAAVVSMDGDRVGTVERIVTHDNRATHMLVSHGLLFKEKKLIPVGWVTDINEDEISLGVHTSVLTRLPAYED
jgi:uncharacterized protein YrrD